MALRTDANGDYLERTATLPPASFPYTWCAWVRRLSTAEGTWVAVHDLQGPGSFDYFFMYINVSGGNYLTIFPGNIPTHAGTFPIALNTWYFIALVCDGDGPDTARAYGASVTDSSLTLSDSQDPAWSSSPYAPIRFRMMTTSQGGWVDGRLACVKSWTAALTVAELEAERWYAMPVRRAGLWYCNPMEGPASAFTQDYSGNGNTMTAFGTLTLEDGPPVAWAPRKLWRIFGGAAPPTGVDAYLLEDASGRYRLEDGTGVYLLETPPSAPASRIRRLLLWAGL